MRSYQKNEKYEKAIWCLLKVVIIVHGKPSLKSQHEIGFPPQNGPFIVKLILRTMAL